MSARVNLTASPSVCFSLPHTTQFKLLRAADAGAMTFTFAPFDGDSTALSFSGDAIEINLGDLTASLEPLGSCPVQSTTRTAHVQAVREAVKRIIDTDLDKVVLSTVLRAEGTINLAQALQSLRAAHPNAFVYAYFHPESGLWLGATPEVLVASNHDRYETVSLAGTRLYTDEPQPWGQKESLEQSIVTDYIKARLHDAGATDIRIGRPETIRYGEIEHIKSILRFRAEKLEPILHQLHPTPAVCGTPFHTARKVIRELEDHARSWYTGYLGFTDTKQNAGYFVNLRCARVYQDALVAYSGGGITFDSDPEDEWEETRNKLRSFLSAIDNLRNLPAN